MIFLARIADVEDPLKLGRAKLVIPALGTTDPTDWAFRLQLPGVFFGPTEGDNALAIMISSRPTHTYFWLGPIDAAPDGVPTTPRADEFSQADLPKVKVMDFGFAEILADPTGDQLIISTRPPGTPSRITFDNSDSDKPQITISPGGDDVLFEQAGQRLAMVGDKVVVNPDTGIGSITTGSVPAQARFFR